MGDQLKLSGERLVALYHLVGDRDQAAARARDLCLEQTVEVPADLVTPEIEGQIVGRVEALEQLDDELHQARVSFAVECASGELTQLLNLLFGNISLKPGIRLQRIELPPVLLESFRGPRFGRAGLRALTGVRHRPMLCTALKPMGRSARELAELAFHLARGGVDLIKDDHGLSDQPFCSFNDRVDACAAAVARANAETGGACRYFANVSAPADQMLERARRVKRSGGGGMVLAPGLVGFDSLRALAEDDGLGLPILTHPALLGSVTMHPRDGMSHGVLYGQLTRLAGADGCIFPSYGGRFSFTREECRDLVDGCGGDMGSLASIFPVPAGGMTLERVDELVSFYGADAILLIGGDLLRRPDLEGACRGFVERVERASEAVASVRVENR